MTNQAVAPPGVHQPAGAYSHAVATVGAGRNLYVSGQLGIDPQGNTPATFAERAGRRWHNIVTTLAAAGLSVHDLVKVTTFLTDIGDARALAAIREPFLDGARPASALVAVAELVMPEWLIEVEAIAFKRERGQTGDRR